MLLNQTQYPSRYRRSDTNPDFFHYEQQMPVCLGSSMADALGSSGVIVACRQDLGEPQRYWLDPDLAWHDHPDTIHFIWLCDQWQEMTVKWFRSDRIRSAKDIEESFAAQGVQA